MDNFKLLAQGALVTPLLDALDAMPDLWKEIVVRQQYPGTAHHATESIFLRCQREATPSAALNELEVVDYPALNKLPSAGLLMYGVAGYVQAMRLGRAVIVKLTPGGVIDLHCDGGPYAEFYTRFHLPLLSDEGNSFTVGDETVHMKPGELWWFNHRLLHTVRNESKRDRLHLIVDAVPT